MCDVSSAPMAMRYSRLLPLVGNRCWTRHANTDSVKLSDVSACVETALRPPPLELQELPGSSSPSVVLEKEYTLRLCTGDIGFYDSTLHSRQWMSTYTVPTPSAITTSSIEHHENIKSSPSIVKNINSRVQSFGNKLIQLGMLSGRS